MNTASDRRSRVRGGVIGLSMGKYAFVGGGVLSMLAGVALAGPEGEQVVRGSANVTRNGGNTLIEAGHNSIINYSSFNIGANEAVRFIQPDASSRVLNRINSVAPTQIDGNLASNGIVYLVNPSGVMFGKDAVINVGGIYAAAGNISDANFLSNVDHFTNVKGAVVNNGTIDAGVANLIGKHVVNNGVVLARDSMTMVAGDDVYIGEWHGRTMVKVNAASGTSAAATTGAGVTNRGTVRAGRATLAAGDVYSLAISNTGTVAARDIQVRAEGAGKVEVAGTLDASSAAPGRTGGRVEVLGGNVALSGATIDASGAAGGGTVLVGGDFQGKGDVPNATQTFISRDSTIRADATVAGDGGRVIAWSDDRTGYAGHISARGAQGGAGGFAEVSGKETLVFQGTADLGSDTGRAGSLLLDPRDITVAAGGMDDLADAEAFATGTGMDVTIAPNTITAVTDTGTDVTLQASRDITVNNAITTNNTDGDGGDLTFQAGRSILLNANITTDNGNLVLVANEALASGVVDADRTAGDAVITMTGSTINTGTGDLLVTMSDGAGLTNLGSGDITFEDITTTGNIVAINNGTTAGSGVAFTGAVAGAASITAAARDGISVTDAMTGDGPIVLNADANADAVGDLVIAAAVDSTDNPVELLGATIDLTAGTVAAGAADVVLAPSDAAAPIGMEDAAQGFNVTEADLLAVTTTGSVFVGQAGGTHAFTVGNDAAISVAAKNYDLLLRGGDVTFTTNGLTGASDRVVNFVTGAVTGLGAGTSVTVGGTSGTVRFNTTGAVTQMQTAVSRLGASQVDGSLSIVNDAALALDAVSTNGGALDVTAGGAITSTATINTLDAMSMGGAASFTTLDDAGAAISLTDTDSLLGELTLRTLDAAGLVDAAGDITVVEGGQMDLALVQTLGNATLTAAGPMDIGATTVGGAGSFTAGGAINDSGTITVTGATSFKTVNNAGASITLDEAASLFGALTVRSRNAADDANAAGVLSVFEDGQMDLAGAATTGNATFQSDGPMDIGATTVGGTGSFTATGAINDSGTISVTGATSFTTLSDAGAAITLDQTGSLFGALTLRALDAAGTVNAAGDISAREAGQMDIASLRTAGNAAVVATGPMDIGATTVGGTGSFTAGGAINDSGTIAVTGATAFKTVNNAGANITLDQAASLFGALTVRSRNAADDANAAGVLSVFEAGQMDLAAAATTGNASFQSAGPMDIGPTTIGGNGSFIATGAINDSGTIAVTGTALFETRNIAGRDITLDQPSSTFGAITANTLTAMGGVSAPGDIAITENATMDVASVRTSATLALTAPDLNITGITAATDGITLRPTSATSTIALNDATGAFSLSAAELGFLSSSGTVTIGAPAGSGAVAIGSAGAISLVGESFDLVLNGGDVTFTNGITLSDNGQLTMNVGAVDGSNAATDVTIGGASGTIVFNTTGAVDIDTSIALLGATTFGGDLDLNNGATALAITGAIDAGANSAVITADSLDVGGTITADGGITLQPFTASRTVGLNDAAGGFNLTAAELANLSSTGVVTIGRSGGTGAVAIGSAGAIDLSTETFDVVLRGGDVTFTNGLTLRDDGQLTLATGAVDGSNAGVDVTIGGATGTVAFSTSGAVDIDTAVAQLGASTLGGNLNLDNGAAALAVTGAVAAGANAVTITTDTLDVASTITANGGITLQPFTASRTIALNDATGDFSLTSAELGNLASTGVVTVGRADGTGAVAIGSAGALDLSAEAYSLNLRGGDAAFSDTLTLADNTTLRMLTGAITSAGAGLDVVVGGATGSLLLDTTGAVGTGANPLSTDVARLAAATTTGGVFVANDSALTLSTIDAVAGITAGSDAVELSAAAGNLTADAGATVTAPSVTLSAAAGRIGLAADADAVPTATASLSATASTGINVVNTAASLAATLSTTTGTARLSTTGDLATAAAWNAGAFEISSSDITIGHALTSTAQTAIRRSTAGTVGLGDAAGDMTISNAELAFITANGLAVGGGNVTGLTVDGITDASTTTIAGTVTLVATAPGGDVNFSDEISGAPSSFNALFALADNRVNVASAISTDAGDMRLEGGSIVFAPDLTIDSMGTMTLTGLSGDVSGQGGLTLRAQDSAADVIVNGDMEVTGGLTVRAGRHITLAGDAASNGATVLNADSDANGVGDLTVDADQVVSTGGTTLDIRTAGLVLNGSLNSGAAPTNIRRSTAGTIGLGGAAGDLAISAAELSRITAGTLTVGGINATGIDVDGVALADIDGVSGLVTLEAAGAGGVVQFSGGDSAFGALTINALDGVSANAGLSATTLTVNADTDSTGPGALSVGAGKVVSSGTGAMDILAADLVLDGGLAAGSLSVAVTNDNDILLGGDPASMAGRMTISDAEFGRISADALVLGDSVGGGSITVDTITTGTGADSPDLVTLKAAGDDSRIVFSGASAFKALIAHADNGIAVNADVTAASGDLTLLGDLDGAADGLDGIAIADGRTLTSGGLLTLVSTTGGITGAGDVTLSARDLTLVNAMGVAGGLTITRSGSGTIGLGDAAGDMTISRGELRMISAETLDIGGDTTTLITVSNVTGADNPDAGLRDSANITGLLTLAATADGGEVRFTDAASTFNSLAVNADDGVLVGVNLSTLAGPLSLDGDADSAADDNDAVTIAESVEIGSGGALTVAAATGGVVLTGAGGTINVLRATDDAALTLGAVRAPDNASLTVTSQGTISLAGVNLGAGNFSATADANSNDTGVVLTVTDVTAGDITLATGTDGNDIIRIGTDFAAGGDLTIRDAGTVELAAGVDLTAGRAVNVASGIGSISLTGGAGTTNIVSSGANALVALGPVTSAGGANLTVNSEGDVTLASVSIGSGALSVNVDSNNDGTHAATVGAVTAGSLVARALGGNDTLTFNGPVTASAADGIDINAGAIVLGANMTAAAGDVTLQGSSVVGADLTISTGNGGGDITFLGPVNGASVLTVAPGTGNAAFAASVGGSTALRGLIVPASGSVRFESTVNIGDQGMSLGAGAIRLIADVASVGDINFAGPVLIANDITVSGNDVIFASTLNSEGTPRSLSVGTTGSGVTTFAGVVGGTSPLASLLTNADGSTRLNANVFTSGGMTFLDAVVLTSDVLLRDIGAGGIAFGSTINSDAAATPRALTLLVNTDTGADLFVSEIPIISFGGNVGSTARLSSLRLNLDEATGADGRAAPLTVATIVARQLDASGQPLAVDDPAFNQNFAVSITTSGDFIMGLHEKFSSLGGLSITAGGVARVGDLSARGDLAVIAPSIVLRARNAGPVTNREGLPDFDSGADFVGRTINFSTTPTIEGVGFPVVSFGTEDGTADVAGTLTGFSFRSFGTIDADDMVFNNRVLDLRSAGPTNTNIAPTIAGAIPRENQSGDVAQDTTVGQAQQEQLTQLGVFARDLGLEELLTFLVGRSIYDDFPEKSNPDALAGDYRVAVNRLDAFRVEQLLLSYNAVFNRDAVDENGEPIVSPETGARLRQPRTEEIRESLQNAVREFRRADGTPRDFDPALFMTFLEESPDHAQALADVRGLREVFLQLSLIGLTPLELNVAKGTLLRDIPVRGISAAEFEALITGPQSLALDTR